MTENMWDEKEKKPVAAFLMWTFSVSWGSELLLILLERFVLGALPETVRVVITFAVIGFGAGLAPMYAVAILLKKHGRIRGFKDFCGRVFRNAGAKKTVTVTAIFFAALIIPNLLSNRWLGNPWYLAVIGIPLMVFGGGLEEIGWRGFLQPALEERLSFVPATVLAGLIWAVWHYPLWLVRGANQSAMNILAFTFSCVALAFLLAVLLALTKSVFACLLAHSWINALGILFAPDDISNAVNLKTAMIFAAEICLSIIVFYTVAKAVKKP